MKNLMSDPQLCEACGFSVHYDDTVMKADAALDDFTIWDDAEQCIAENHLRMTEKEIRKAVYWCKFNIDLNAIAIHFNVSVQVLKINMVSKRTHTN